MRIKKYNWRNFNSYGNKENELDFMSDNSSLNLITAENGAGKTTCSEVLEFNIFGKVTGKNLDDLPNRINKNLKTYCEIETKSGLLQIERNLQPNFTEVKLDGKLLSDIAGKKNVQKYIEKDILDVDNFMFKNLVVLDINKFKSFVKMSKHDKKTLIDRVFGLDILTIMFDEVKDEVKENNIELEVIKSKIQEINSQVVFTENKILDLSKKIEEQQKIEVTKYEVTVSEVEKERQIILNKYEILNNTISKEKKSLKTLKNTKVGYEYEIKDINKKIKLYNNSKCPMCNSNLQSTEHLSVKNEYEKQLFLSKQHYTSLSVDINNIETKLRKYLSLRDEGNKKIANMDTNIQHLNEQISSKRDISQNPIHLEGLRDVIINSKCELTKNEDKFNDIHDEIKFLNIIGQTLSESGIKKRIINQIIPQLNMEINTMLIRLGLGYSLKLDSNLNSEVEYLGRTLSINTLSTGEHKKFDFAVLISFIKMLKTRYCDINLLYLDEIFSSLDSKSIETVSKILKEVSNELELHIFLINHSIMDSNLFDNVLTIDKDKLRFSNLINKE